MAIRVSGRVVLWQRVGNNSLRLDIPKPSFSELPRRRKSRLKKKDIKAVEAIAKQFGMNDKIRRRFGDYLEECKARGDFGTRNKRGDFTWSEMEVKAKEFFGLE